MAMVQQGIQNWPKTTMAVVGSSLGGFYATWVATHTGCKAVLLNPAVDPARDLARYIGEQTSWQDPQERFFFEPAFIGELQALALHTQLPPERCLALLATGDEVLDWREMAARYASAQPVVIQGSDHALSDFDAHIDGVFAFLDLLPATTAR
jgi:predicted esterase YcpF (UPF0227 family)